MRIRRKASARFEFPAKILQFLLGNSTFKIGTSVYSRRSVSLVIHDVSVSRLGLSAQEVIESNLVKRSRRSESRDVTADTFLNLIGSHHHGQRIPAHQALYATLHLLAAGKRGLLPDGNRILVGRSRSERKIYTGRPTRVERELLQQPSSPVCPTF